MNNESRNFHELSHRNPIVFFDGVCGLCNAVVDWIMPKDSEAHFRFAPLQGAAAAAVLSPEERSDLNTVVVLKKGRLFRRSDAIVEILLDLRAPWHALGFVLRLVPRFLRDLGYRVVAQTRYQIFGKREICRLPTREERARFFD